VSQGYTLRITGATAHFLKVVSLMVCEAGFVMVQARFLIKCTLPRKLGVETATL